jgi:molybdenum cofactor biosynthesis protein B
MTSLDETRAFIPLKIAVLTVSGTHALTNDRSGDILVERLGKAGHELAERADLADGIDAIRAKVTSWIENPDVDVVLTTGGTGVTGRDNILEAVEPLFEKRMDGFAVVFHRISYEKIVNSTIQSRATAGKVGDTLIFCVPGSPGACKDAWDDILSKQLDFRTRPCNFVEVMPWLEGGSCRKTARA